MPRACTVCPHPKREEVEAALRSGEPYRSVAKIFSVAEGSLYRHMRKCMPRETIVKKAKTKAETKNNLGPLPELNRSLAKARPELNAYEQLLVLRRQAQEIFEEARNADKPDAWLMIQALDKQRQVIESTVRVFEAQRRIEATYARADLFDASMTYKFLKERHPEILEEFKASMEEARLR